MFTYLYPPQEKIERRLTTDLTVAEVTVPSGYNPQFDQTITRVHLQLKAPSMDDQTDDLSRLVTALRQQARFLRSQYQLACSAENWSCAQRG